MKQFFADFHVWEDYINGMYEIPDIEENKGIQITNAIKILSDNLLFDELCRLVLEEWIVSSKVNLTNTSCNRRAWLGQAACSYKFNVTETCTRIAWGILNEQERISANAIADKWIKKFESKYENENRKIHFPMGEKLLF